MTSDRQAQPTLVEQTIERLQLMIAEAHERGEERLPPETSLIETLGVGRSTLREALAFLESNGVVVRKRRVGTLIPPQGSPWDTDGLVYPVDHILAFSDFLADEGVDYDVRELSVATVKAPLAVAKGLGLAAGTEVFDVGRMFAIDREPVAYLQHFLPREIDGRKVLIDGLRDGVTTFLSESHGIQVTGTDGQITAEAATAKWAERFGVTVGSPLLVMNTRLSADGLGTISLGRLVFRSGIVSLGLYMN